MKLTEIAIEGYGVCRDLRLGHFADGLNIVFGEAGSGKSTICDFVRGVHYGFERFSTHSVTDTVAESAGSIDVRRNGMAFRLSRQTTAHSHLQMTPLSHIVENGTMSGMSELTGSLDISLYDTIYNIGFGDVSPSISYLTHQLISQLNVPLGQSDSVIVDWKAREAEIEQYRARQSEIQLRIDQITAQRHAHLAEFESKKARRSQHIHDLDKSINELSQKLSSLSSSLLHDQLAGLNAEIVRLQNYISSKESETQYVQPAKPKTSGSKTFYRLLDEIDAQIKRWKIAQQHIQTQRLRLRDEMIVWNEMTLESSEHPYHTAHGLLVELEAKIDKVEHEARQLKEGELESLSESLLNNYKLMRDDVFGLSDELGKQYKHLRHKSAAMELKQLRAFYNEAAENIQQLVARRESVLQDIARFDSSGVVAIQKADSQFIAYAHQHGYLEARRRYVGDWTEENTAPVATKSIVDLSSERTRLNELGYQKSQLDSRIAGLESECNSINTQRSSLIAQRDQLVRESFDFNTGQFDVELSNLRTELELLSQKINVVPVADYQPNTLLQRATNYLHRMTLGELENVWLCEAGSVAVHTRGQTVADYLTLANGQQAQVYLSLCLATIETLSCKGVTAPMLLDELFANINAAYTTATLEVLNEFCNSGHQVILFSQRRDLAQMARQNTFNITTFELPQTTVNPTPIVRPERMPSVVPTRAIQWHTAQRFDHGFTANNESTSTFTPTPVPDYPMAGRLHYAAPTFVDNVNSASLPNHTAPEIHRFNPAAVAPQNVVSAQFPVEQTRSALQNETVNVRVIDEATSISACGIFDPGQATQLINLGIRDIRDLLELDATNLPDHLVRNGYLNGQIDRWQSQAWLMVCVPGMRPAAAKALIACGITEPEQLDTTQNNQLLERILRFMSTSEGRRISTSEGRFDLERLNRWYEALDSTRTRWRSQSGGYSRRNRNSGNQRQFERESRSREYQNEPTLRERNSRDQDREPRHYQSGQFRQSDRGPQAQRPERNARRERTEQVDTRSERRERPGRSARASAARDTHEPKQILAANFSERKTQQNEVKKTANPKLKFYLDLSDHVEAAPSIGPKTAERFEKIGVSTIRDFLKNTAESMAKKIAYKRISADAIRQWQHQARLVCRIPNLRGHDAQLLVACDITEPEDIADMNPKNLFDIIGPFSDTKEGLKIIRNGKKPDLDEINDWISWAAETRSLQAA